MSSDDKLTKALPLPGALVDPQEPAARGADGDALKSIKEAIEKAGEVQAPANVEAGEAAERRRLISEIRMMRRFKPNVAVQAAITGVKWGAMGWAIYRIAKALLGSKR